MAKVLIIEDDINIRNELQKLLIKNNYLVDIATDFKNINTKYDVILLDINLPGINGFEICKKIRKESDAAIIFVTSSTKEEDELKSIISGGDDFITKPYNTLILLEKIKRAISKEQKDNKILTVKDVTLNLSTSTITYKNKEIELTRNERKIMYYFFINPNKPISKSDFIEYLWNDKYYLDEGILIVNITRLRKKLEEVGLKDFIITERKVGYRIWK